MLVEHIIEDLREVLESEPECAAYQVAIARYKHEVGGEIMVQPVGSYSWDEDGEFFLNPSGTSLAFELEERIITARGLLQELEAATDLPLFVAYARDKVKLLPDGSIASLTDPLWGIGIHDGERLLLFYYGKPEPES